MPEESNNPSPSEQRYLERREELRRAKKRNAVIRLIIRATALVAVLAIAITLIVSKCAGKKAEETSQPQSDIVYTSSQQPQPEIKLPTESENMVTPDGVNSHHVAILNLESGEIIASKQMHERIYPASLTKIMTLLVAAEENPDLDKTYTVTTEIIDPLYRAEATLAGFVDGEDVTINDLLYGTVLPSGAEAAECVALATAGSVEGFVELMNEKVKELGLKGTHFTNVTGLHDKQNYSTAYDMAVILAAALESDKCREIMETYQYTTAATNMHPNGVPLTATLFSYMYGTEPEGADILGGKTGYTDQAGYCIATFGKSDLGTEYICVTAKGDSRWPAVFDQINLFTKYAK